MALPLTTAAIALIRAAFATKFGFEGGDSKAGLDSKAETIKVFCGSIPGKA